MAIDREGEPNEGNRALRVRAYDSEDLYIIPIPAGLPLRAKTSKEFLRGECESALFPMFGLSDQNEVLP
jgi:hypothetical protein